MRESLAAEDSGEDSDGDGGKDSHGVRGQVYMVGYKGNVRLETFVFTVEGREVVMP